MAAPCRPNRQHPQPNRADEALQVLDQGEAPPPRAQGRLAPLAPASSHQLFRFCQLDFSFPLGPADGRYLARRGESDLTEVLVFKALSAPRQGPRYGRRARKAETSPPEPETVQVSRVTVIVTPAFDDEEAAEVWLERCRGAEEERDLVIGAAVKALNRVVQAQRVSAADPYLRDVTAAQALSIRVGYGTGDDLVEGRWRAAYSMPPSRERRQKRRQMFSPQEEVAAILTGRARLEPSDDLMLRARLDLDQDRVRQAALQLRTAIDALEAELRESADREASGEESAGVSERKRVIDEIAAAALRGPLDDTQAATLEEILREAERRVRRRRYSGG